MKGREALKMEWDRDRTQLQFSEFLQALAMRHWIGWALQCVIDGDCGRGVSTAGTKVGSGVRVSFQAHPRWNL